MLKKILGTVVVVVVVLVGVAYLLPRHVHVERSVVVDRPAGVVFQILNSFKHFQEWSPWVDYDPNAQVSYSGPESGVGAKMAWAGNDKVGKGSQLITASEPGTRVATDLDFGGMGSAKAAFVLKGDGGATRVTWLLDLDMGNGPIGRYMGLFMDGMIGKDYEKGLTRLKALAEKLPADGAAPDAGTATGGTSTNPADPPPAGPARPSQPAAAS
jgi:hypothetical protein